MREAAADGARGRRIVDLAGLIDKKKFQELQDMFADALDLGFIAVDYRGRPIIKYSGFTEFCNTIRKQDACRDLCYKCDAHGGLHAAITGQPYIYRCHAGLVDFAVPLILDGKYVGALMGGQVELIGPAPTLEPVIPQTSDWQDDPVLVDAVTRVHKVTYEKLLARVDLLRDTMQNMLEDEYRKATEEELQKKDKELRKEKAARLSLEEAMETSGFSVLETHLGGDFFFHTLNVLARMAYHEQAMETEHAICSFSSMVRYLTENSRNLFVTVGEELEFSRHFLQIQAYRSGGALHYAIDVPDTLHSVLCPFMLLQPLLENAAEGVGEEGRITIHGREDGAELLLIIADNGSGMTRKQIAGLLELSGRKADVKRRKKLTTINRRLKELFGPEYGLSILSREDGLTGTQVQIRLPIKP